MINLQTQLKSLACIYCRSSLTIVGKTLRCTHCHYQFPIINGLPMMLDLNDFGSVQTTKLGAEALFTKPLLYKAKINLLLRLNKTDDISVDNILLGKAVLDIGCGPFTYGYDTKLPASITGIDLSPQFVQSMSAADPSNFYIVASAAKIPYVDKSFDVSLLRYILHHIPGSTEGILKEVARVTRGPILIFDHVLSESSLQRKIQARYWALFDGGHHYYSMKEWDRLLSPYKVTTFRRTGRMFGNICQIIMQPTKTK